MKRFFFFATAAIVALASCTKTKVVYTDAPEEIGFKAVTGVMTKASSTDLTGEMGVFAYLDGGTEYFNNISFKSDENGVWTGDQYWPGTDNLTFTCYAPYDQSAVKCNAEDNELEITCDNTTNPVDWLYGATQPTGNKTTYESTNINVELAHALAQVELKFTGADNLVALGRVTLNDTMQKGTCTVSYANTTPAVTWSGLGGKQNLTFNIESKPLSTEATTLTAQLVVPVVSDNASTLSFTYVLNKETLTYTVIADKIGNWQPGKKYVYEINIGAQEIKFSTPKVLEFGEPDTAPEGVEL